MWDKSSVVTLLGTMRFSFSPFLLTATISPSISPILMTEPDQLSQSEASWGGSIYCAPAYIEPMQVYYSFFWRQQNNISLVTLAFVSPPKATFPMYNNQQGYLQKYFHIQVSIEKLNPLLCHTLSR